jgi:hypothetical protein
MVMRTNADVILLTAAVILASGCGRETPASPSPAVVTTPSLATETFHVSGTVSNQLGIPLEGVPVSLASGVGRGPTATTDVSGRYSMELTMPLQLRRANIFATPDDRTYDWYYRNVSFTGPQVVENVTLRPIAHMQAGDQTSLVLTPDNGLCWSPAVGPCTRLWVRAPAAGKLTIEVESTHGPSTRLFAVADEVGGNPVTISVTSDTEIWTEVGSLDGTSQTVVVKSSFQSF